MSERDISEIAERLRARLDGWPDEARMAIMCADLRAILDDRDQLLEADALSIETIMTMNRRITQLEAELAEALRTMTAIMKRPSQSSMTRTVDGTPKSGMPVSRL